MTNLTPDTKYLLAERLSGADLVRLCATDTSMREICQSSRYHYIWRQKLQQEFGITYGGDDPYTMYLQSVCVNEREQWVVVKTYGLYDEIQTCHKFFSKSEAINFVIDDLIQHEESTIPDIVGGLDRGGMYIAGDTKYLLSKAVKAQKTTDHMEVYHEKLTTIARSFKTYKGCIEEFISDFREEMELSVFPDKTIYDLKTRYEFGENTEKLIREIF